MDQKPVKTLGRKLAVPFLCLSVMVAFTGCASNADTLASPGPTVNYSAVPGKELVEGAKDMLPGTSPQASASPNNDVPVAGSGLNTLRDIQSASEQMEDAVDMLSEVEDAQVIAIGNRALVAVEFEPQYQGELDERMQQMLLTRIQTVNKGVTEIFATSDPAVYEQVEQLTEKMEDSSLGSLTNSFDDLVKTLKGYSK